MIRWRNDVDSVINLDGPEGNAFPNINYASRFANQIGL